MFEINRLFWKIEFKSPKDEVFIRSDGSYTIGCTDYKDKIIYLSNDLYGKLLHKVLIHEISHAFVMSYGIYMDIYSEEVLCDFLATYAKDILHLSNEIYERINGE